MSSCRKFRMVLAKIVRWHKSQYPNYPSGNNELLTQKSQDERLKGLSENEELLAQKIIRIEKRKATVAKKARSQQKPDRTSTKHARSTRE